MGFDPRGKRDKYANYFTNNRNIMLIQRAYALENPRKWSGYGDDAWGFSAGVNNGGGRPLQRDDNGTLEVHAALGAMPIRRRDRCALRHYYRDLGPRLWGVYGFPDSFNESQGWYEEAYMALDQAQTVAMIENYRTGLLWKLFMSNPKSSPRSTGSVL
nr:glucoamylase family protein [Sphingomonas panacisoli]